MRFALYAVALQGVFCVISHVDGPATFVRTDQWLGRPFAHLRPELAAAALLRRYLAAYGPSTVQHFAEWAGVLPAQAARTWQELATELTSIKFGGKTSWVLAGDLPILQTGTLPRGVRLLPPHDPYLATRDRTLLVPDRRIHTQIWRTVGSPGVVLLDGEIVAVWRAQKLGAKLRIEVTDITGLDCLQPARTAIEEETACLIGLRGCQRADIIYT